MTSPAGPGLPPGGPGPAKMIYLARRNPVLSRDEFPRRWRKHAASVGGNAAESLAEITSTRYCHVRPSRDLLPLSSDEYDGVALIRLASLASIPAMGRELVSNEVAMADELRAFSSYVKDFALFCAEWVVTPGPPTGVAVLDFVRRRPDLGPADFLDAWAEQAGAVTERLGDAVRRQVLNVTVAPAPPGFGFDGVSEVWLDSLDAAAEHAGALDELGERSERFLLRRAGVSLLTEVVMAWDPAG